jgi:NAD(P)H-flavin reductase
MLYTDEFDTWREHDIQIETTVDRADMQWTGHVGVVPMLFYYLRLDAKKTAIMTCGPEIMMRFVIHEALARRVARDNIYISMERNMKCGIGLCGHCQFGPTFMCKEGPILSYPQVEPFFGAEEF